MSLKILLADDHRIFRKALRMLLEDVPGIDIVAEVADGRDILAAVSQTRPDMVCMDINMPGLTGIEATRQLLASYPDVKVIGLSAHDDALQSAEMFAAGALEYVVKSNAGVDLLAAIRRHATI